MNNKLNLSGLLILFTTVRIVSAQNVVATCVSGQVTLAANPAMVTFVPSKANTAVGAAQEATLSAAQGQAVMATMARALPIPIIGPFAGPVLGAVAARLHAPKPEVGYSVAFVEGVSAKTVIPQGEITFRVPASSLQAATPVLLRTTASTKDSTRIIRSLRLSVKVTGKSVVPNAENTKLLSVDENVISCRREADNGDTLLIPASRLDVGEYAVALIPDAKDNMVPVGSVWDFQVAPPALPKPVTEAQTITKGQTQAQITAALGTPEKVVKLGAKEIYCYTGVKIIFINNKVADIE
jgi:hypothetical protein